VETNGGHGVLEIFLRRGLLWKRQDSRLKCINFSVKTGEEKTVLDPVPSWSWMAYDGAIEYMDVPLEGADWDQWERDVISPWTSSKDDGSTSNELQCLVRGIAPLQPGARVFLDDQSRLFKGSFKCVVVGSSKGSQQASNPTYYVLIVASVGSEEDNVYVRAGVGFLRKHQIVWDNPAVKALIH
jgi:hypothetical protein